MYPSNDITKKRQDINVLSYYTGVYASYNTDMHTLSLKSTTSFKDLCFHLEIRVAGVKHRNDTCLLPDEDLVIGSDVQQGQLWLVACGRGTCSEPSLVQFVAGMATLGFFG